MAFSKISWSWRGPPLVLQILLLLLGGLVVAQAATLMLTLVLPPAPAPQHGLDAIAAALRGDDPSEKRSDKLERRVQADPPDLSGQGWLVSDRSQRDLAALLNADVGDVRLAFYTPLPFAGTVAPRRAGTTVSEAAPEAVPSRVGPSQAIPFVRPVRSARLMEGRTASPYLVLASQQLSDPGRSGLGGGPRPGGIPPGGMGGVPGPAGGPGGTGPQSPAGSVPGPSGAVAGPAPEVQGGSATASSPASSPMGPASSASSSPTSSSSASSAVSTSETREVVTGTAAASLPVSPSTVTGSASPTGASAVSGGALSVPRALSTALPASPLGPATSGVGGLHGNGASPLEASSAGVTLPRSAILPKPRSSRGTVEPKAPEDVSPPVQATPNTGEPAPGIARPMEQPRSAPQPLQPPQTAQTAVEPARPQPRGLFGLAPAPFVEGDFIAALRLPDGRWAVVEPTPEPFPNSWQRRVLLWFAMSFALTAPLGWLFARRIVKPLSGFVEAAELLGRDPSAVVGGLDGPAEIGRAARAFNRMQTRLKAFVDDRTAMVGAISHDLRTPLTRLRFRIEDIEHDAMRDGMIGEVEEMEQMITSVLAFIRDASTPGVRERLDLRTILDDVVRKVTMIGGDVRLETAQSAPVEVDILGIRRLVTNLVENAVKYGERARICLRVDQDTAVAEVSDDGPGVPEDELERVFEPFYRATNAGDKKGSGLGLAVCRSIARAHGGDVRLIRSEQGSFVAQLRIPLYHAA